MSKAIVLKAKEFNVENVQFSQPKTTRHGSTVVYLNYKNPEKGRTHKLRIQLPKMPVPGGIQAYEQKDKQQRVTGMRYSLFLSFANIDTNKRRAMALEKLKDLDARIVDELVENCKSWLKQPGVNKELARMLYKSCVKVSKDKETGEPDGKFPDSIKVNIPSNDDGDIIVEAYDEHQNRVNLSSFMEKGSSVIPILECSGLWVVGSQLHLSWKIVNIQVFPSDQIRGFAIRADSDEETTATEFDGPEHDNSEPVEAQDMETPNDDEPEEKPEPEPEEKPEA